MLMFVPDYLPSASLSGSVIFCYLSILAQDIMPGISAGDIAAGGSGLRTFDRKEHAEAAVGELRRAS